jgi:hypothetical protein
VCEHTFVSFCPSNCFKAIKLDFEASKLTNMHRSGAKENFGGIGSANAGLVRRAPTGVILSLQYSMSSGTYGLFPLFFGILVDGFGCQE